MSVEVEIVKDNKKMAIIPLRGMSVFPYMVTHFDVGREKSIMALEETMMKDQLLFVTTQEDPNVDLPTSSDFYKVGAICKLRQMLKLPGNTVRVLIEAVSRGEILNVIQEDPFFEGEIQPIQEKNTVSQSKNIEAYIRMVRDTFEEYISLSPKLSPEILLSVMDIENPAQFADTLCANLFIKQNQRQELLEMYDVQKRLDMLYKILLDEIDMLEIERKIDLRVKKQVNRFQKEYYLREQIRAIQKELGEDNDASSEGDEFAEKLKKLRVSAKIKEKIEKEIQRYSRMSPQSPESHVIRTYLENFFALPWNKASKERFDIQIARDVLNEDHYGLDKVKERIIEYMAVRNYSKNMKAPILCLSGPPGVGKTSIAKSIARSLGREFVRISLGGIRDEAEIRGHRRTYIGAIPGRIINGLKEAKVSNPVFLFDEIDKMSSDFRGDPASAMLEVLDPEQNKEFTDHYMEIPFDLSKVLFITTANMISSIPQPLFDRMEVITLSSYTDEEKIHIGKDYLLGKQLKEHSLDPGFIRISNETMKKIINDYTREAGVREFERQLGRLCRKCTVKKVENPELRNIVIKNNQLVSLLGKPKYHYEKVSSQKTTGSVTGLAWTQVGGDTLQVEVSVMEGSGKLELTGQLGDVMKESARAALSFLRTISTQYKIEADFYKTKDIHIHIPEGAIPKDGPSAGVTMAVAILSALSEQAVEDTIAMTGEITLRGKVLPVGGIKEKVLAAFRAGIKTIFLPMENRRDLDDIPLSIRKKINFISVERAEEIFEKVFCKDEVSNEHAN